MKLGLILLAIVAGGMGYVRLAPSDPARWHLRLDARADQDFDAGVIRILRGAGPDALARLDRIAQTTPRTRVLAGSVDSGMITYIVRSRVFGFPDYVTVAMSGDDMVIHARLRFGKSDIGVNRARTEGWISQLQHLGS